MSVSLTVRYDREEPTPVRSPAELDAVLDQVARTPRFSRFPVMVELADAEGERTLDVGIGRSYSVLVWSDWTAGEVLYSDGTVAVDETPAYNYGGTWTEYDAAYAVPSELAVRAVREFSETGAKPASIAWRDR